MLKKYLVFVVVLIGAVVHVTSATASCDVATACPENVAYTGSLSVYECKCKINPTIVACKDVRGMGFSSCWVSGNTCSVSSGTSLVCGLPNIYDEDPCDVCNCVDAADGTDVNETGYLQKRCHKVDTYRAESAAEIVACHAGKYLDPQNPMNGQPYCRDCPPYDDNNNRFVFGATNEENSGNVTSCYMPFGAQLTDNMGMYTFTSNCPYSY